MKSIIIKIYLVCVFLSSFSYADYIWSTAIPKQVHIVPEGLVLVGDFDRTGVDCANGPSSIFLPKSDVNFEYKLSLALTAKASNKRIQVLLNVDSMTKKCQIISAGGSVPVAFYYYWRLID